MDVRGDNTGTIIVMFIHYYDGSNQTEMKKKYKTSKRQTEGQERIITKKQYRAE